MADKAVDLDEELALLLQEQEQFMRQSEQPAAKLMRRGAPSVSSSETQHKSQEEEEKKAEENEDEEPMAAPIVGRVVERDVVRLDVGSARLAPVKREATGFPVVRRRGESLFGRRQKKATTAAAPPAPVVHGKKTGSSLSLEEKEREEIGATNDARLQEMTPQEIREAQEELMRSLDPVLVEKLRSRGKAKQAAAGVAAAAVKPTKKPVVAGVSVVERSTGDDERQKGGDANASATIDLSKITTEEELQASAQLLPPEERAKHEWMQSASKAEGNSKTKKLKSAQPEEPATLERFDFDGRQISGGTGAEVPSHSGLFHHGEDPDAPGYTMPELLHLARSSVASQRAMALTVISKVLLNRQDHERTQPESVVPKVLPRELPVTLRIALDDQNYTALSAGVSALHSFLVPIAWSKESAPMSHQFELAFGTVVPPPPIHLHEKAANKDVIDQERSWRRREVLYIDDSPDDDGNSINDEDMAAMDPVQGLLHMDIGTRFRFILDTIQLPDLDATEKILDILTAIARHSPKGAREIATNARLMKVLQQKFIENEDVLTLKDAENENQDAYTRALRLTLKSLVLVRSLCQGERAAASVLMSNGVIQGTKGFLALKGKTSSVDSSNVFVMIQIESLRIWRVLLGYALDFHCFAYLFPLLSGFTGADLVRTGSGSEENKKASSLSPAALPALFAALEAFCGLASVHEAQHYFNQLSFFITMASDRVAEAVGRWAASNEAGASDQIVLVSTAMRFLSAAAKLASKFRLETQGLQQTRRQVDVLIGSTSVVGSLSESPEGRDLLLSLSVFTNSIIRAELVEDMDDEEVALTFFKCSHRQLLKAGIAASKDLDLVSASQACALLVVLADMAASITSSKTSGAFIDARFMKELYGHGLALVTTVTGGMEFWISKLFSSLLFQRSVLGLLEFFSDEVEGASLSNVLVPVYQALVNSTRDQELHSARHFASHTVDTSSPLALLPRDRRSYHLRMPQYDQEYVSNNLPLPSYWMYCPFSRMEYDDSASSKKPSGDSAPSRAQSDEMKLIVSAACRFLYQFETKWSGSELSASLNEEDKLFHLLHVFFAGSDVLFDEHVDVVLDKLLATFVAPIVNDKNKQPKRLYDGVLRNLKSFQHLESGESSETRADTETTFTSDEQVVMTFVEKLVAEFSSTSYANVHFARTITLFLAADFPLAIRKWVWKELNGSRMLHALAPFSCRGDKGRGVFWRCALAAKQGDEQLMQLMMSAVRQTHATPERGAFAYELAIQHLTVYLFQSGPADTMSGARQQIARELIDSTTSATRCVWRHLLSCETSEQSSASSQGKFVIFGDLAADRLERIRAHAALSETQRQRFEDIART